jgi:hypothetical protein
MPATHHPFDPAIATQILAFLRAGGMPHVAAEAAGLPYKTYRQWLRRGGRAGAAEPFRQFACDARTAVAQSRLKAEIAVREKDPKFWLKYGPGKETPDRPGWTGEVRPRPLPKQEPAEMIYHPQWRKLCTFLLQALDKYPEARLALVQALQKLR